MSDMEQKMQDQIEGGIYERDELLKENDELKDLIERAIIAIEAILKNREIGEYESHKQGLPRMIEVNDMGKEIIKEARSFI